MAYQDELLGAGRGVRPRPQVGTGDDDIESILRLLISRKIPRFQFGGIARRPTLAMIGEGGPEAVLPLGNQGDQFEGSAFGKLRRRGRRRNDRVAPGLGGEDDPLGPQYISRFLRRRAQRTADARRRRAGTLSSLSGLDRMGQRQAMIDADISAGSDLAGLLGEADIAGAQGFVDYRRQLDRDEREAQRRREEEERRSGSFGGFLGEAAGSLIPGAGRLFRRGRRGGNGFTPGEGYYL